jgi:hypothetical protein
LTRLGVKISTDTTYFARSIRTELGMLPGSAADVSVVQDDAMCEAATAGEEREGGTVTSESFVVVRIGQASPFYLLTRRQNGGLSNVFLLNAQFVLLSILGSS